MKLPKQLQPYAEALTETKKPSLIIHGRRWRQHHCKASLVGAPTG